MLVFWNPLYHKRINDYTISTSSVYKNVLEKKIARQVSKMSLILFLPILLWQPLLAANQTAKNSGRIPNPFKCAFILVKSNFKKIIFKDTGTIYVSRCVCEKIEWIWILYTYRELFSNPYQNKRGQTLTLTWLHRLKNVLGI